MRKTFNAVVDQIIKVLGTPVALLVAAAVIAVWAITGPIFGFSDTWQLFINTGTTIVTFLMVFVIQNSQNRDAKAVHIKLDELIRSIEGARNRMVLAEQESEEEQERDIDELVDVAHEAEREAESAVAVAETAETEERKHASRGAKSCNTRRQNSREHAG